MKKTTRTVAIASAALAAVFCAVLSVASPVSSAQFPGGNGRIGYSKISDGFMSIQSVNPDGSGEIEIVSDGRDGSWNNGATKMAYVTSETTENTLVVANGDGTGGTVIYTAPTMRKVWYPSMSADGTKVAFMQRDPNFNEFDLYVINADGTGIVNLTVGNYFNVSYPQFSPDGTKVLFSGFSLSPLGEQGLQVADLSTPAISLISEGKSYGSWAPDGLSIYGVQNVMGQSTVYRMNADGTGETTLFTAAGAGLGGTVLHLMASPDGTKFVFSLAPIESGNSEIWTTNIDGTGGVAVAALSGFDMSTPNWTSVGMVPVTTTTTTPTDPVGPAFTG